MAAPAFRFHGGELEKEMWKRFGLEGWDDGGGGKAVGRGLTVGMGSCEPFQESWLIKEQKPGAKVALRPTERNRFDRKVSLKANSSFLPPSVWREKRGNANAISVPLGSRRCGQGSKSVATREDIQSLFWTGEE
jgi:hypothetical protein